MKKRFETEKISRAVTPLLGRQHGFLYSPICEKSQVMVIMRLCGDRLCVRHTVLRDEVVHERG